jgi:hypothetical protein
VAGIEAKPNMEYQDLTVRLVREQVTVDRQVRLSHEKAIAWREIWTHHGYEWNIATGEAGQTDRAQAAPGASHAG